MWHETKEEMIEFLKSIFRMDEDQSARRVAQKYLGIVDPDYYELEGEIFNSLTSLYLLLLHYNIINFTIEIYLFLWNADEVYYL